MDMKEWIQYMHYYFIKIIIANKQSLNAINLTNKEIKTGQPKDNFMA
jgi:hypothetical protein